MNYAVVWESALLAAVTYVPFLQNAFGTFAFSAGDWALTLAAAVTVVPVLETVKWFVRRGYLSAGVPGAGA